MTDEDTSRLFELADLIHGVGRQLRPPPDLEPGMCTPIETTVMRFINNNPGTSARTAAEGTLLPSSNFSRVVRSLETKGLVRREADVRDARGVRLYPTDLAQENRKRLRSEWSRALEGIFDDPSAIDFINTVLRRVESELIRRRKGTGERKS